jgi:hypothetical protein
MAENGQDKSTHRLAGYAELVELYNLDVIPNWHRSSVSGSTIIYRAIVDSARRFAVLIPFVTSKRPIFPGGVGKSCLPTHRNY